jgi:hypothetical protein
MSSRSHPLLALALHFLTHEGPVAGLCEIHGKLTERWTDFALTGGNLI